MTSKASFDQTAAVTDSPPVVFSPKLRIRSVMMKQRYNSEDRLIQFLFSSAYS